MLTELEERVLHRALEMWVSVDGLPLEYTNSPKLTFSVTKSKMKRFLFYFHWLMSFSYLVFALYRIPVSVEQNRLGLHLVLGMKHLAQNIFCLNGLLLGQDLAELFNQIITFNQILGIRRLNFYSYIGRNVII